jgi:hypothetical protein
MVRAIPDPLEDIVEQGVGQNQATGESQDAEADICHREPEGLRIREIEHVLLLRFCCKSSLDTQTLPSGMSAIPVPGCSFVSHLFILLILNWM